MAQALLSLQHITVRSLTTTIFNNLNFTINKGENWALIGESGSGKTALLHTIAGNLSVTNGEVTYNFPDQVEGQSYKKHIALVEPRHHFRNLSNTTDFYYQQIEK